MGDFNLLPRNGKVAGAHSSMFWKQCVYVYVFAIYSRRYIDISKIVIFRDYSNKLHNIDFIYPSNLLKNFLDTSYPY